MARFRRLKQELSELLARDDWRERLGELDQDPETLVNPLLALRLARDELVCWRAVEALGRATAQVAETAPERARTLMRTFMWYMNEESGNLGWGIPEAMATAMVENDRLAREYHTILASYVYCEEDCDGNYLDHPELRRGVYWGLGLLAEHRPELVEHAERFLVEGCRDEDAVNRALAVRTLGILAAQGSCIGPEPRTAASALTKDKSPVHLYLDGALVDATVADLARNALARMG